MKRMGRTADAEREPIIAGLDLGVFTRGRVRTDAQAMARKPGG
jgi:hypothetical protein